MTISKKNPSALIRVKDMPEALGVSRSTIRRMIDAGTIRLTVLHARCVGITEKEKNRIFEAAAARSKTRKPKKARVTPKAKSKAAAAATAAH